ncbi:methionyl-tRNA formyltransferase [Treponema paraluiscuniculi Cuniculi A]|uniref:Methionyl-tRNA formyltransferase n=2 Tax=Treponema paraluiscuniculi TaxID=53435 RepID=F7XTH3_TREPU|nr:methionyl-tRNA formyltransferase [Treponema paraluiscuniculi]AEH40685.1 methionyl-tRNA formyltransferase [Treponema paraluiscuniculi Cuniculi A]WKC72614.1 methionyl-tRNA formyltransferase [Treponema paraluiscuniculi]
MVRVFFAGTPECAVPSLRRVACAHRVVGVLTNPPAAVGRSGKLVHSAVAREFFRLKASGVLPESASLFVPGRLDRAFYDAVEALRPDVLVCFAYGRIFGPRFLALFPRGAINVHPSLLPRWRGSTPVPAAILAGDCETGVTLQYIGEEMDAGDILAQSRVQLDGTETTGALLSRLSLVAADLVDDVLVGVERHTLAPAAQDHSQATFCGKLCREMGLADWSNPAVVLERKIRAFTPWPGLFTYKDGERIAILQARSCESSFVPLAPVGTVLAADKNGVFVQTGDGVLSLLQLQRSGKKPLFWRDFLNGSPLLLTGRLGV